MKAAATNFRLGLLVLVALAAAVAVAFGLGAHASRHETIRYDTYFDESVEGLEIGAPVKYRGVPVGSVGAIEVAPDDEKVDVALDLDAHEVQRLRLGAVPPELRAQLGTQGITGVKLVDLDFFDPKVTPPPALSFPPGPRYIPAAPSLLKGLTQDVGAMLARLPSVADAAVAVLERLDRILEDFQGEHIPGRFGKAVDDIDGAVADLRALLRRVDRAHIPDKAATALDNLGSAVAKVDVMLDRIGGDAGLVASTKRATDNLGELERTTTGSADDLQRTLRDLDEAAQAIRDLAQDIEREPDMLVKGRARGGGR